jgi:hypothetical protein
VPVQVSLACTLNAGGVRASWILQKLKIPTGLNATPALNLLGSSSIDSGSLNLWQCSGSSIWTRSEIMDDKSTIFPAGGSAFIPHAGPVWFRYGGRHM